ncbi:hypothetical protein [uncultured Aquimarina sp.]|uniref:hypothetical protein n=1 Tax=uncultured Aquimarina sp. TaxID=575652 RepID=UPI002639EE83|nr:hypothetical protein [uncultured Aquimarina sp.]
MRINLLLLFCLAINSVSCQEKYEKEIIFLGEYNDQNELKVFKEDSVVFINKDSLSQVDQFKAEELIKLMEANELYFIGEGDEPFWQFKINSSKLFFKKFDSENEKSFSCKFYYDQQSGFNLMFKSNDNKAFGLIRRVDHKLESDKSCSLGLSDNYLVYETFITVDGTMYKGCTSIDKN